MMMVSISLSRQWGGPQQRSLDNVLNWMAELDPADVHTVRDALRRVLSESGHGNFSLLARGGELALEAIGTARVVQTEGKESTT